MIILGRSHDKYSQGAKTITGTSEWEIAKDINDAIEKELYFSGVPSVIKLNGRLGQRIHLANVLNKISAVKPDCIVECHCNSSINPSDCGYYTMAWRSSNDSESLAKYISQAMENMFKKTRKNLGVCLVDRDMSIDLESVDICTRRWVGTKREYGRAKWLGLLANTKCPAVIVETCYLTNPEEGEWIETKEAREDIGWAVARGIFNWGMDK